MNSTLDSSPAPGLTISPTMDLVTWIYFSVTFLAMATCVGGMAGNSLVIWLLSCNGMQRSPFCVYVLNLAVADFLFLFCMASMLSLETGPLLIVNISAKIYEGMRRIKYFAYTAGLSLLTAISTQRCLSVLFCVQFWHPNKHQCFKVDIVFNSLILGIFMPVMILTSTILFIRVRKNSLMQRRRPRRLYVVILTSILVFLTCSLPLGINWFLLYWVDVKRDVRLLYSCVSRFSSSLSSSANPVIYFLVGSQKSHRLSRPKIREKRH